MTHSPRCSRRSRRHAVLLALGAALCLPAVVSAQAWPSKPINIVTAYPPGGVADQMARVLATELSKRLGQPVTVENRTGASGMIGANYVAKAAPDGHTLLMAAMAEIVFNPYMHERMAYRPDKDLVPVAMTVRYPFMLVANPALPVRSVADVVALAKKEPGQHTYATAGNGSVQHIAMEMFARTAGIQLRHIPYKGVTPALTDVLGNQVSMMFAGFPPAMTHVKAGKLTPIGLSTKSRLRVAPDIPSVSETPALKDYDFPVWVGLFAPAGVPAEVLDRIHRESVAIFAMPAVRAGVEEAGMTASDESRAAFAEFVKGESAKYGRIIKEAGIKDE
ncbi:tripartite tricarboxylate transporter substrate binding protein [Variovorax sp. KK3]|uniref:Bug family tripartite tricarboxylate transporter substrate binding protein n=1 Tax=Variovorax sp. KK3 TaxID=1855728 RepID=UPI00097C0D4F|nr:tripartite tricarboxylate transporter substrate binding protein [Variovorax sp. KK3]